MSVNPIFIDTLFFQPSALTSVGATSACSVSENNGSAATDFVFQVTVSGIGVNVVVRAEGSLDGTNFFSLQSTDTTITSNGTSGYFFSGRPLKYVRGNLVSFSGGTPSVSFIISAK